MEHAMVVPIVIIIPMERTVVIAVIVVIFIPAIAVIISKAKPASFISIIRIVEAGVGSLLV
jgi:hypothetical protein